MGKGNKQGSVGGGASLYVFPTMQVHLPTSTPGLSPSVSPGPAFLQMRNRYPSYDALTGARFARHAMA